MTHSIEALTASHEQREEWMKIVESERFNTDYLKSAREAKKQRQRDLYKMYWDAGRYVAGHRDPEATLAHQKFERQKKKNEKS